MNAPTKVPTPPPYAHTPLFQLGKDETKYRKIGDEGPVAERRIATVRGVGFRINSD